MDDHPFLQGSYAPVSEELTALDLPTTGRIPDHLDGRYLRIGPNPLPGADPAGYHWFTGPGMVHGLRLRDGRAEWYRNRWVRSEAVATALGEAPRPGPVHVGWDFPANTNVCAIGGRTHALIEGGARPYELTDELATVGPSDLDGTLAGGFTAHPKRDPVTGELHAVSYYFGWGATVRYRVVGTDGRVRRDIPIRIPGQPMVHDFSLTERHVVLYDLPVTLDVVGFTERLPGSLARRGAAALRRLADLPMPAPAAARVIASIGADAFPYVWDPDHGARVGVMDREGDGRDIRWYDVEPCYVFHPVNAHDDGDSIVLDLVRHQSVFDTERRGPREGVAPTLDRWTIDRRAGKVIEERLDDRGQEFPRVDERRVGRRARYAYTVAWDTLGRAVMRHDLASGATLTRDLGGEPSEVVFVPSSPDAAEDDGVVMGFVDDPATGRSDLAILDAATLEDVARVHLPGRVPLGFHGNWVPA